MTEVLPACPQEFFAQGSPCDRVSMYTAPLAPPLRRAITEPPPSLANTGLSSASSEPMCVPLDSLDLMPPHAAPQAFESSPITPPPPAIGRPTTWAVHEKNTFLSFAVPEQPGILRSRTDPMNLKYDVTADDSDEDTAPPPLPPPPELSLEFLETDDGFWPTCNSIASSEEVLESLPAPPLLSLEYVATDDPFRPTPSGAKSSPPPLSLEYVATDDPFRSSPKAAKLLVGSLEYVSVDEAGRTTAADPPPGLPMPPPLSLEYVATDDPFQPFSKTLDLQGPPGLPGPPPALPLEKFDTDDPYERPLALVPASEPAFVRLPPRSVLNGPPPPPAAPAPFIGTPEKELPPLPPPPAMPLMPAPEMETPTAHEAPSMQPGHTPGAGLASLLPTELRQPGLLARTTASGCTHVHWAVDSRKLEGADKQAVSPVFKVELPGCGPTPFKLVLYPKPTSDTKHGAGFKKAKGQGRIVLKCEAQMSESHSDITFRMGVGRAGKDSKTIQAFRGPQTADFSEHTCHGLAKQEENWDFNASVDDSRKFIVTVEIAPTSAFRSDPGVWWTPLPQVDSALENEPPLANSERVANEAEL